MNPRISSSCLPFFKEGLQHQALRVLWSWNLPEILRELTRSKPDKSLFFHPDQGFLKILASGDRYEASNRFSTIGDQHLHPGFHLIQIFAETGFEVRYRSRFQNSLLFSNHYSQTNLTCRSYLWRRVCGQGTTPAATQKL